MNGWTGTILRVDLSDGKVTKEETAKYLDYTGGIGIGYKVIFDEAPLAEPFSPDSRLVFAVGPLTGTLAPSTGRSEVIGISPHVMPRSPNTRWSPAAVSAATGAPNSSSPVTTPSSSRARRRGRCSSTSPTTR